MPQPTIPPPHLGLPSRVTAFVEHLQRHRELPPRLRGAKVPPPADPALLREALEQLEIEHEELGVAEEELRAQLESLTAAERECERQTARYREVFDFGPDPTLVTDREGCVLDANLAALQALAIEARFLQGKPLVTRVDRAAWPDLLAALDRIGAEKSVELALCLRGRRGGSTQVTLRGALTRDGARIVWSAREQVRASLPPGDEAGGQVDVLGRTLFEQAESIRRLQRENAELEGALREAREAQAATQLQLDAKERALAVAAHELRGPLNVVVGWARLLLDPDMTAEERAKGLSAIERHGMIQASLVGELIDASALASGLTKLRFEIIDLGAVVARTVGEARPLAEEKSIELRCEVGEQLRVLGDAQRLTQVVTNLLTNAIKFTPPGGRVVVGCEQHEGEHGRRTIRVTVEDSGRGLEPEEAEAIFGFFERGKAGRRYPRSLGLGLYLVRQFVELHGGTVAAENVVPGGGTRFTVSIPMLG